METRTFRAPTMIEALQTVQKELGSDAIVISMRELEAGSGWWRKPACEIVAAKSAIKAPPAPANPPAPDPTPEPAPVKTGLASTQATATRPAIKETPDVPERAKLNRTDIAAKPAQRPLSTRTWISNAEEFKLPEEPRPSPVPAPEKPQPFEPAEPDEPASATPLARISKHLLVEGLDEALVQRLERTCLETLSPARLADAGYLTGFLKKQMMANLPPARRLVEDAQNVVCVIGPAGAGKTSVLAKLAAHYALQTGQRVAWIEANTVRSGAIAEARVIAESFGVELHLAYTSQDMVDAFTRAAQADLVLVDTPGCNPRRESSLVELGEMITRLPRRTTLLAAPATTKDTDLKHALAAFSPFQLDGLAVTRLDEASSLGSIYNLTWRSKIPVMYSSASPMALDELSAGDNQTLVDALFSEGM